MVEPGDLVEVDTLDLRPLPGVILKHFTARDLSSRWDVVGVYTRATAVTATSFLGQMRNRMPFKVSAIQVDGGSEFCAQFEDACKELGIRLFVLPPRSPNKLAVLLRERGWQVSTSMVGRILSYLKARGVLKEAPRNRISTRKRLWRRPYAIRRPRGYPVMEPGDLVQVDTLDVRPLPGVILKH